MTANYMQLYQQKLNQVLSPNNLTKIVSDIIVLNTANVITDVRHRWEYGQSVRGGIIGRYREPMYAEYKRNLNPNANGTVDLMLTGSLVDHLTLKRISEGIYQVISTDEKYTKLAEKYGSHEFGITDEQRYQLYEDIEKVAIAEVFKQIYS